MKFIYTKISFLLEMDHHILKPPCLQIQFDLLANVCLSSALWQPPKSRWQKIKADKNVVTVIDSASFMIASSQFLATWMFTQKLLCLLGHKQYCKDLALN